jgi:hypothetical protein
MSPALLPQLHARDHSLLPGQEGIKMNQYQGITLIVIALGTLAGCAQQPIVWYRDGATQNQFEQDRAGCIFEAKKATASYGPSPRSYSVQESFVQGFFRGMEIGERQLEIFKLCMVAKGYREGSQSVVGVPPNTSPAGPIEYSSPPTTAPSYREQPTASLNQMNRKVEPDPPPAPALGKFTVEAERLAKTEQCHTAPLPALSAAGPGFESYTIPCVNGDAMSVRCEFGNCRALK